MARLQLEECSPKNGARRSKHTSTYKKTSKLEFALRQLATKPRPGPTNTLARKQGTSMPKVAAKMQAGKQNVKIQTKTNSWKAKQQFCINSCSHLQTHTPWQTTNKNSTDRKRVHSCKQTQEHMACMQRQKKSYQKAMVQAHEPIRALQLLVRGICRHPEDCIEIRCCQLGGGSGADGSSGSGGGTSRKGCRGRPPHERPPGEVS